MLKYARTFKPLLLCVLLTFLAYPQDKQPDKDLRGSIVDEKVYTNPVLGMKIMLPGTWELLPQRATQAHPPSDCVGPLCGDPQIDVGMATKAGPGPAYRVYLAGYRLAPEYLDRHRNPLSKFAEVMMAGSLGSSDLVPLGAQTALQLDGKAAYRMLAGKSGETVPRIFGYVSEANGYVFLLVGSAQVSPHDLQSAIEAMKLAR